MALRHNSNTYDPNHSKRRYQNWTRKNTEGLFENDIVLIEQYLYDMEHGINTARNKKGSRSYSRLNALMTRIPKIAMWIKERFNKPVIELTTRECTLLFNDLRTGKITKKDGSRYQSYDDYTKDFLAFWNWYTRKKQREYNEITSEKKKSVNKEEFIIENIMQDVDPSEIEKPKFVYLNDAQYKHLRANANYDYRVLMDFLMDSGIRSPTELMNVKVSDIEKENKDNAIAFLNIRDETSKTFGRKIKLMFSYPLLKEYIDTNKIQKNDFIFTKNPNVMNRYLRRLGFKVLKIGEKTFRKAGRFKTVPDVKNGITLYDFRHNSACYWLPRYKSEIALRYRFAWKSSRMIEYYTEFLGMKDTIAKEDMLVDVTKTDLENELQKERQERQILDEKMKAQELDTQKRLDEMQDLIYQSLLKMNKESAVKTLTPELADRLRKKLQN
jgi:hypothetical protein